MDMVIGFGGVPSAAVRASAGRDGAAGAKKNCEIGVDFSFAALSVFRLRRAEAASALWIPHWHSEPFESEETRAAKGWVKGSLVERGWGDESGLETASGWTVGCGGHKLKGCRGSLL